MCTDTVRFLALFSFKTTLFSCIFVDEWPFFVDDKMEVIVWGRRWVVEVDVTEKVKMWSFL